MITAKTLTAEQVRTLCRAALEQIERVQAKKCPLLDTAGLVSVILELFKPECEMLAAELNSST